MADDIYFDRINSNWEEEALFARDVNGQLIRAEPATRSDYAQRITLQIDGQTISVPKAVPTTDSQGNVVIVDGSGRTIPRRTTIYDAAVQLAKGTSDHPRSPLGIPTLCHAEHLPPVGVCRVCSVQVAKLEKDRRDPTKMREVIGEKLLPACVQPVEEGMLVQTLHSPDAAAAKRVGGQVKVLLELLAADRLPQEAPAGQETSELQQLISRLTPSLGINRARLAPVTPLAYKPDKSSQLIDVDHNACILCDRCSRACTDIKENYIIGRTGKGYFTRIGFDLNDSMGDSGCVECGECMLHCPTTALTFREPIESDWFKEQIQLPGRSAVTPEQMDEDRLLRTLPFRYRQWNQSSVVCRQVKTGEDLCRLGEHGSTAFILRKGTFGVWIQDRKATEEATPPLGLWQKIGTYFHAPPQTTETMKLKLVQQATSADLILGEMSCLNHYPRSATIRAETDGEVLEIRRNMLYTLQRNSESREILDEVYRQRALENHLRRVSFFSPLSDAEREACQNFLLGKDAKVARPRVSLLRLQPGQTVFRQGETANNADSAFYMVRIGYVKVSQSIGGEERVINYLGPDSHFGELGLLAESEELANDIPAGLGNRRTASCTAMDDVELVVIKRADFLKMILHPRMEKLKKSLIAQAKVHLSRSPQGRPASSLLEEFTEQGLYNAQKLLVLDLEACTRCDECVKACADTHEGTARFVRDGLRFDKYLIASACRSCTDPYCLVGCPVDAIHRDAGRLEIKIENHCIGCGLCANNCPYGNINMHITESIESVQGKAAVVSRSQATMCDLCTDVVGPEEQVSCVFACPHHAAFRVSGKELLDAVSQNKRL